MKKRAFLFIIAAGILWGTSGIFVNLLSPYGFSSLQMSAMRGTVSFLCFAVYAAVKNIRLFRVGKKELLLFVALGISLFGTGSCYFMSMQMTSISTAVVLMYMAPVYVVVFSVLFFGERLTPLKAVSVAVMLVGCALVSGVVGGLKFDLLGILFGILSGIAYGAYNILTKIAMKNGSDPVSTTLYGSLFMAVAALSVCDAGGLVRGAAQNPAATLPLIIGVGVITFVLPYFLYTVAMRALPAGTTAALGIIEPMAATVFSIMIYGERLTLWSGLGMVLILGAVILLGKGEGYDKGRN